MTVYETTSSFGLGDVTGHYEDHDADLYFTHFDTWMEKARKSIPEFEVPYASYVIVDHYPVPKAVTDQVQNAHETIAMSKWAREGLAERGIRSRYIPHGVHTDQYKPLSDREREELVIQVETKDGDLKNINPDENNIFGMVAAKHGERKNMPAHMEAFKKYIKKNDDEAILYIHTDPKARSGFDLERVRKEIGIPMGNIIWSNSEVYQDVGDSYLNKLYNAFDVLMNCSYGESWGLTITEAQSAGTPAIVSNFSSMPEQLGVEPMSNDAEPTVHNNVLKAPHGVMVEPAIGVFREKVSAKQFICHPKDIYKAMKWYAERPDVIEEDGEKAREHVKNNYDWEEDVIPAFDQLFNGMEAVL